MSDQLKTDMEQLGREEALRREVERLTKERDDFYRKLQLSIEAYNDLEQRQEDRLVSAEAKVEELKRDKAGLIEDSLSDTAIINSQWSALHNVEQHWLFRFLPRELRCQVRNCLGNPDALR